jgi:hypothetical protein
VSREISASLCRVQPDPRRSYTLFADRTIPVSDLAMMTTPDEGYLKAGLIPVHGLERYRIHFPGCPDAS